VNLLIVSASGLTSEISCILNQHYADDWVILQGEQGCGIFDCHSVQIVDSITQVRQSIADSVILLDSVTSKLILVNLSLELKKKLFHLKNSEKLEVFPLKPVPNFFILKYKLSKLLEDVTPDLTNDMYLLDQWIRLTSNIHPSEQKILTKYLVPVVNYFSRMKFKNK
jgi:hypothetical protein